MSYQEQINGPLVVNALRKHTRISIVKISKAKSEIPENKNEQKKI